MFFSLLEVFEELYTYSFEDDENMTNCHIWNDCLYAEAIFVECNVSFLL